MHAGRAHALLSHRATAAVAATALAVFGVGTTVVIRDELQMHHCSGRGEAAFGNGLHSSVKRPERFIGLPEKAARELAKANGYTSRIICRDGQDLLVTMDLRSNRIGFGVHHGRVVGYWLA